MASNNKELLDRVNKVNQWVHVKKTGYMWAKKLDKDQEIKTLEGVERAKKGQILCRGIAGELWPQEEAQVLRKYKPSNIKDGDWVKYLPRPELPGFMATTVRGEFDVKTAWGTMHGKDKDYLVKNLADSDVEYPSDVWVVDRKLFNKSYVRLVDPRQIVIAAETLGVYL
eukprot:TRINITY_DN1165_c0_g1_i1.p1 TRINITY_DN1165_c0_g1~~TRINITY_DN1165_c0_g1_i1.p1  ORF type:complete len:169 (+),score=36.93 TRINITY_DN1165_c0_g1_i1:83-589(+)